MTSPKPNKQRVNISVDPSVHACFTQYAERNNQSVSRILNDVMELFCRGDEDGGGLYSATAERLRQRLVAHDSSDFQQAVRKLALAAGFYEIETEETHLGDIFEIPEERRSEWYGTIGKTKIGIKLAFDINRESDVALGRALMFRGLYKCDRLLLVVPFRLGVWWSVLTAAAQSGLEVVGVDLLEKALHSRTRKEESAVKEELVSVSSESSQKPGDDLQF